MRKIYLTISFIVMLAFQGMAQDPFITSWSVTDGDEIIIPINTNLTYDFDYVWKDDTGAEIAPVTQATGDIVQQFSLTGTVTLEITGVFPHFQGYPKSQLLDVQQWGDIVWESFEESFQNWTGTGFSAVDKPDLSQGPTMLLMFRSAINFNENLNTWEVGNITNMQAAFRGASSFNGDISNWDVSKVTNMLRAFEGASQFDQDLSNWDISQVSDMRFAFDGTNLSNVNYNNILIAWSQQDVQEGVNLGASGLSFCEGKAGRNVLTNDKNWTIIGDEMFCPTDIRDFTITGQVGSTVLDTTNFEIVVTLPEGTNRSSLTPSFTLFEGSTSIPASGEVQSFVNPATYTVTAADGASQAWTVRVDDFKPFITSWSVTDGDEITIPVVTGLTYDFAYVWKDDTGTEIAPVTQATGDIVQQFSLTGTVTLEITGAFPHFRNYPKDKLLDVVQWGDIVWGSFIESFRSWQGAAFSATDTPDLSRVTNMARMFQDARAFNGDLSNWDVSNVRDMNRIFLRATSFNSDLSNWDVSNVTNMQDMFQGASSFNGDLSAWNVNKVTNMQALFKEASAFNADISSWNVGKVTNMSEMLDNSGLSPENYDALLIAWSQQDVQEGINLGVSGLFFCEGKQAKNALINTKNWTISGDERFCSTDIRNFAITGQSSPTIVDSTNFEIVVSLPEGSDRSALTPSFTLFEGSTSIPASGEVQSFVNPATYTVTATDGASQAWTVQIDDFKPFITTWSATAGESITIGLNGSFNYDFTYIWKDAGGAEVTSGTHTSADGAFITDFTETGEFTLEVAGVFPHFQGYPKGQLLDVQQWGDLVWRSFAESFQSWKGTGFTAADVPNLNQVTSFFGLFQEASFFNGDLSGWDVSNVTNMERTFRNATAFNQDISGWSTISVTTMNRMFANANAFNQDISGWDISSVTDMTNLLNGSGITTGIYDKILIGWSQQEVRSGVTFGATGRLYCAADAARTVLDDDFGWTINDAGQSCEGLTDIQSFSFEERVGEAIIDAENFTITATALFDTDLTALTPSIGLAEGVTSAPGDGETVDFTNPVTYTVTYTVAGASTTLTQDWEVAIVLETIETDILTFSISKQVYEAVIDANDHTIDLFVLSGTDLTLLVPDFTLSEGATSSPKSGVAQDFTNAVTYTITGRDGITDQDWVITVSEQRAFITSWSAIAGEGISIGLNGSFNYDFTYIWKDAGGAEVTSGTHTSADGAFTTDFTETGEFTLEISGVFPHFRNYPEDQLLDVQQWGDIVWGSFEESFRDWTGTSFSATDVPDLSQVTNISAMFRNAVNFNDDINDWQVGNVTNMSSLFLNASSFNSSISDWDVGQVRNMREMFSGANDFTSDLSNWNVNGVTNLNGLFQGASNFNSDLNDWDVSQVTNMFATFEGAQSFNGNISGWDVSNVTSMESMFEQATSFNGDLSDWDVSNVTNMSSLFLNASNFNSSISGWDVSNVNTMEAMFDNADAFNQDLDKWNTGNVTNMSFMFARNGSFNGNIGTWNVAHVTTMFRMFQAASAFNQDLTNWNPTSLETMFRMFDNANSFNGDISTWNVESVTNMGQTFLNADAFNQDLSGWDVSSVTTMNAIFNGTSLTPQNYDKILNGWAALPGLQEGVSLGAEGITFCKGAAARAVLTNDFGWDITDSDESCSDETDILSFVLTDQTGDAVINSDEYTISIEVLFTNVLDTLAPGITLSPGATSDPVSGEQIDFASPVSFTVTAEDGTTTQNWVVTVTVAPNTATNITGFELPTQTGQTQINTADNTIAIEVAFGTEVSSLIPTFTLSEGATSNPISGEEADFSDPVVYTIIAQDGTTTQDWTVSVTVAPNTETDILTFILAEQTGDAVINTADNTIAIEVEFGTEVSALVPTITLSEGATSNPASGAAQDFTNPVTYVVTAQDGTTTQDWTVSVTVAPNTETDILTFILAERTGDAVISTIGHTVVVEVAFGTEVSALVPTFTLSEGATSNPASGVAQDFTNPVTYVVTAEDGTTSQEWIVTVTIGSEELDTETDILTFSFAEQTGDAVINTTNHTVTIEVTFGTDISALAPTSTLSEGATSNPASGVAQDFTSPVTYIVTAEDSITIQEWTVIVTVADSPLGLDDEIDLRIYPNPVSHVLQVKTKEEVSISLTDLNGRVIIGEKQGSMFQMSLSNLKNGIYLLVIRSGNEITSRRIIKTN